MRPDIRDAKFLELPEQVLYNSRYLAAMYPGLGVCVYAIGDSHFWQCQLFPLGAAGEMHTDYIAYTARVSMSWGEDEKLLRGLYPFFSVPDILTLKARIIDAAERWKEHQQHEHL